MTPTEKLQALYDSEINLRIEWFWDGGVEWKLGDLANGFADWGAVCGSECIEGAIEELWLAAKERFPNARCFK